MKIIMIIIAIILITASLCLASPWDNAVDYITERPLKSGIIYDFDSEDVQGYVGTALLEDILIDNLDIDGLVASNDPLNSDSVVLYGGASYTISLNEKIDLGIGIAIGTERIESIDDFGQCRYGIYGSLKF